MCNTCGCKAAEDSMVRKHRPLTKKQRQDMQDAVQDVDYMRDKFDAMETFPAGDHDIEGARSALEARYPNIEILSGVYMIKQSGSSNAYHVFIQTSEGHFNLYGRIGYGEPKIYGPMTSNQSQSKMTSKAKRGYRLKSEFGAEEVSHNYTPKSYDPLTESPQLYNPITDSYSAEGGCGCGNYQCNCAENVLFIDKTGEEAIMDEYIDEGEDYDDAKDYARKAMKHMNAEGRKRRYGKRQRFDHIKGNSRYLARNAKGRWISNVGVSGSIKQDLRSNAKSQQPVGFRGLGDATTKHAEGGILTNATIQWEDGIGTSSPSSPPYGIHFGAEAYTDFYPQNSAEVDGMTGNGVPVAYGSGSSQYVEPPVRMGAEEGFTYMHKDFIPNTYGEDSALSSGRGVPQWYGAEAESNQDIKWGDVKEMDNSKCPFCFRSAFRLIDEEGEEFSVYEEDIAGDNWLLECSRCKAEWNQDGENTLDGGYTGNAEEFEAMEVFPPSYDGDVANSMARIRQVYPSAQITRGSTPIYMIKRGGSMNRFHVFVETSAGNFNVYGRIGYGNPQIYGPMGQGTYSDKMRTKLRKGYSKFKSEGFENPMIDQGYYPNSTGESSAVISGNGVPQWYGSAETYAAHSHDDDQSVILNKPIETGIYLGFGFMLASLGATVAAVLTGMLLGE
jgi:hypothetical protein